MTKISNTFKAVGLAAAMPALWALGAFYEHRLNTNLLNQIHEDAKTIYSIRVADRENQGEADEIYSHAMDILRSVNGKNDSAYISDANIRAAKSNLNWALSAPLPAPKQRNYSSMPKSTR